jgi:hypothetical protein
MNLCKFSNSLGIPNKGIHSIRLFNVAIIDVIFTILGAFFLYYSINKLFKIKISFWIYLIVLFILGILLHKLFCVETTINKLIFG